MSHLNHLHMLGKAYLRNPPRTTTIADKWLEELVVKINMVKLMGPYSVDCKLVGNEGITGAVILSTSHATFHSWHEVEKPFLCWDVYSCSHFDAATVVSHLDKWFDIIDYEYMMVDRNDGVKVQAVKPFSDI